MRETRRGARFGCLGLLYLMLGLLTATQALAAEEPPYEFSAELSLTGGCGTSKADPIPDPGCPERKPPKPFTKPQGIAIDSFGDEYVASWGSEEGKQGRVDIFSPKGVFIAEVKDEFGPKTVAVDSKGVLYTFDQSPGHSAEFARYKPVTYEPAEGKIEYGSRELIEETAGPLEGGFAIDGNDHVLVDWPVAGIKEYSSAAEGNELKSTFTDEKLRFSTFLALDKQRRRLYASSCPTGDVTKCWVLVFNADTHELLEEIKGPSPTEEGFFSQKGWISIAVNEESGDFFVGDLELTKNVYQFNEEYELVSTLKQNPELFEGGEPLQIAVSNAKGAFNHEYLFVPSLKSPNRALAYSPPKQPPAKVQSIGVTGIGEEEAELLATLEPKGGEAHYVFEYLSQAEYEEAGNSFTGAKVVGEGTILPAEQEAEVSVPISGLEPGTAYRFRVSIENETGGEAKEARFATYSDAAIATECPEAIRTSHSMLLPDCRAYELVTPADMGGQPPTGSTFAGDNFPSVKVSPSGNVASFLTHGGIIPGLGGAGSYNGNPYRTTRTNSGWNTAYVGPSGAETTYVDQGGNSADQGYSFWSATHEGSAVIESEDTRYVRYPDGHSALIGRGGLGTDPRARGKLITEGGTHIVFQTRSFNGSQPVQLEEDAPPAGTEVVYDRTADEVTHVVSLLPGNVTPKAGQDAEYIGASADGEGIAFKISKKELYLRVANTTTYEIGEGVEFAGVSEGGGRIFYVEGGNLIAFDTESEEAIPFTETGNAIPVNVSADGIRAYFVSTTAIGGSGENPNGAAAQAGQQNLYLSEEGAIRFVGTVTERDVVGEKITNGTFDGLGLWASALVEGQPAKDPSRTNPSGSVLLFQSRANLDGYSHEGIPEIYRYDSASERLHCVSCTPTNVAAGSGATLESYLSSNAPFIATGFVPNLRADGNRAFFQSTEALVSTDNDGVQDVYEWEEQGVGSCTSSGGCVYLISSGQSARDNYLYAISQSGDDVFFTTVDILVGGDNDALSIYDARVNGGFPEPVEEECVGEGCRNFSGSPAVPAPVTGATGKSGNVTSKPCPKGKHRVKRNGKEVCVKNKKHHRKHHKTKKGAGK